MNIKLNQSSNKTNWVSGKAEYGYKFQAKLYDEVSEHGIKGGRISKLNICKDDEDLVAYDRGWDIMALDDNDLNVYDEIVDFLENSPKRFEEDSLKY